jgi:hypothetical protein
MSAHEKGIEAAARSDAAVDGRDFDGLSRADKRRYLERPQLAIRAYLEASGQVLVPREPTNEMKVEADRARNNALYQDENDQIGALNIAISAAIEAYPQPFSQDSTEGDGA